MKYRKKPVVIEAVQYTEYGKLVKGMCNSQSCYVAGNTSPHVHTIHNNQLVNLEVGDYIIPEPDGIHFYPCKPDIFEKTYESLSLSNGEVEAVEFADWVNYNYSTNPVGTAFGEWIADNPHKNEVFKPIPTAELYQLFKTYKLNNK